MGTLIRRNMKFTKLGPSLLVAASTSSIYSLFNHQNYLHASSTEESSSWLDLLMKRGKNDKLSSISKANVDKILRKYEFQKEIKKKAPILRFETNHYNANNPIEDRHCECFLNKNDAYFFAVVDGHSGWHCAESLRLLLPIYISVGLLNKNERLNINTKELIEYLGNQEDDMKTFQYPENFHEKQIKCKTGIEQFIKDSNINTKDFNVEDLIKYSYLSLDRDITTEAIPDGVCNDPIWAGLSGAVTVGAYIKDKKLYVANTGDCRAVLGYKNKTGHWASLPLSDDHTAENRNEIERLNSAHPYEKHSIIMHQRLLGQLQPLRAFGDVVYKWSKELHQDVLKVIFGRPPVAETIYKTPPYLTAQPDVAYKTLEKHDGFLILATDGLWDTISSELAVQMIGEYFDDIKKGVKVDENGATKLLRYSLGHNDEYHLSEMLRIPLQYRRSYHDDITITVIYLNEDYLKENEAVNLQSKL